MPPKLSNMALSALWLLLSPAALAATAAHFAALCQDPHSSPEQKRTIVALLKEAKTSDCLQAQSRLTETQELKLSNAALRDLSPLIYLKKIRSLDLSQGYIDDLSPLASLQGLQHLNLNHNHLSSLAPLAKLSKLESLNLGHNKISTILVLQGLTSLKELDLSENKIANLDALKNLRNLEKLNCQHNAIKSLNPLATTLNLVHLDASHNKLGSLKPLRFLTKLETVILHHNDLDSAEGLAKLNSLKLVDLSFNPVSMDLKQAAPPLTLTKPSHDRALSLKKSRLNALKIFFSTIKEALFLGGMLLILLLSSLAMIFTQNGLRPWFALLPFYNIYLLNRLLRKSWWWALFWHLPLFAFLPAVFIKHAPLFVAGFSTLAALTQTGISLLWLRAITRLYGCSRLLSLGVMLLPIFFLPVVSYFKTPRVSK